MAQEWPQPKCHSQFSKLEFQDGAWGTPQSQQQEFLPWICNKKAQNFGIQTQGKCRWNLWDWGNFLLAHQGIFLLFQGKLGFGNSITAPAWGGLEKSPKKGFGIQKRNLGILKRYLGILKRDLGILRRDFGSLKGIWVLNRDLGSWKGMWGP